MPSSKRSSTASRGDKKVAKIKSGYEEDSLFFLMLQECGLTLKNGDEANSLTLEQNHFLKKFRVAITSHEDYPHVISEIVTGITKYIKSIDRFVRMMQTTDLVEEYGGNDALPAVPQDSVARLMLKTMPLQSALADVLIQQIPRFENDPIRYIEANNQGSVNVPQLILNQLRWLDTIEDTNKLAIDLVNTASSSNDPIAFAIITSLPEIVGDEIDDNIIDRLIDLLSASSNLTVPILSTVGCLNCSKKSFSNIEGAIFSLLHSQKLDTFPFIVKFLLQTMNADNANEHIARIRPHISFSALTYSQNSEDLSIDAGAALNLIAETVLHAAQYRAVVADAWTKLLKNLKINEFTAADLVTAILLSTTYNSHLRKNAVATLKTKVTEGVIDRKLTRAAFLDCNGVLDQYSSKILDLATQFLPSSNLLVRQFGANLYECMFSYMKACYREDIIKSLVQHVSTFCSTEIDSALDALQNIVTGCVNHIAPHIDILKGIIDHIERLTADQMRQIFGILNMVCCTDESDLNDQITEIVGKYLTHPSMKFRCVGVIGAISTVGILAQKEICNDKNYKRVKSTLSMLQEVVASDKRVESYYYDELCNVSFDTIHPRIRKRFHSIVEKEMSENYLIPYEDYVENLNLRATCGIEKDLEFMIPVYQLVKASDSSHLVLCPLIKALFKIMMEDHRTAAMSLCLLSVQFHSSVFDKKNFKLLSQTEQKSALDATFIACNIFREHINFLSQDKARHKYLLSRINSVIETEGMIEDLLSSSSSKYTAPVMIAEFANFTHNEDVTPGFAQTQTDSATDNASVRSQEEGVSVIKKGKSAKRKNDAITIQSVKPQHFRELAVSLVTVLETPMAEDLFEADVNIVNSNENVTLTAGQALFILLDLKRKICHRLPTQADEKRSPFASTGMLQGFYELDKVPETGFGNMVCNLIPHLCNHLESVSSVFDSKAHEQLDVKNRRTLTRCYECLLEVIVHALSWRGLKSQRQLVINVLFSIARRFSSNLSKDSSIKNFVKGCVKYFVTFENTIVDCSLPASVSMLKVLRLVLTFDSDEVDNDMTNILHNFSSNMLKNDWALCSDQSCPVSKTNELVAILLKINVQSSDDAMKCAAHFVDDGLCKLGSDDVVYPNFTRSNSHVLYGGLLEIMAEETGKIPAVKPEDNESVSIEILLKWNDCMKVVGVIVKLLREYHSRSNILSSLKHGKIVIENFIKNGMPICEKLFHLYQDDIVSTLKHLQSSTRQLQHLTCHSKVTQDVVLAKQVPPLKKCLETLLFRVKAMLAFHSCEEAFWLGNLKNRNIQGEEILSQLTQVRCSQGPSATPDYEDMSYSESY